MSHEHHESSEWDEEWVRICEMEAGPDDPFPDFAEDVRAAMERVGNDVERPLVMKVKIQAVSGGLVEVRNTEGDDDE